MRMKDELDSIMVTEPTTKYGIKATMPKAVAGTKESNPCTSSSSKVRINKSTMK